MTWLFRAAIVLLPLLAVTACHQPGPAERAGRSLDSAAAQTRDTLEPPTGPVERAGRAVDRAANPGPGERAGRALDRATQ